MCIQGDVWISRRRGQADGQFTIDKIDGAGYFTGKHDGDDIRGTCRGGIIDYTREGSRRSSYRGAFVSDTRIEGVAVDLPLLNVRMLLPVDDEWEAEKT